MQEGECLHLNVCVCVCVCAHVEWQLIHSCSSVPSHLLTGRGQGRGGRGLAQGEVTCPRGWNTGCPAAAAVQKPHLRPPWPGSCASPPQRSSPSPCHWSRVTIKMESTVDPGPLPHTKWRPVEAGPLPHTKWRPVEAGPLPHTKWRPVEAGPLPHTKWRPVEPGTLPQNSQLQQGSALIL